MPKGSLGGYKGDFWKYGKNMDFYPRNLSKKIQEEFKLFNKKKIINLNDKIIIFGSCFSEHLLKCLKNNGFKNVDNCLIPSGLNNIFAIKQILYYIVNENDAYNSYSYNKKHEKNVWKGDTKKIKKELNKSDLIILTVGLAEYWVDIKTGGKFWMGIPNDIFDEKIHKLKIATPDEISNEMNEISKLLKTKIMFVLCPVPLNATFTKNRCLEANCISKSICRGGFHNFFSNNKNSHIIYFPVYEMCYFLGLYYNIDIFDPKIPRHVCEKFMNIIGEFFNYLFI